MTTPLLIVIAGPASGRTVAVETDVSIGRDSENVLPILDAALSRHHCRMITTDAGVVLRDCNSRNGVFVNGQPISEHLLRDGDQIRIGHSELLFTFAT